MASDTAPSPPPRDRILDAASAAFAEHGFAGARVDDIAATAGVNKAMLYYHIGDKQALYNAVLLRNFDRVHAVIDRASAQSGSAPRRLQIIIESIWEFFQHDPEHPRIILREFASGGSTLPDEVLERMLQLLTKVGTVLNEGVAAGQLCPSNPVLTHLTIVGAIVFLSAIAPLRQRVQQLHHGLDIEADVDDIPRFLSKTMLYGIACSPGKETSP